MTAASIKELKTVRENVRPGVEAALEAGGGLLRLSPCWVPRDFLHPGRRLKLDPRDLYAFGKNRGGIDERWFGSTVEAANPGRVPDEGLSYVIHRGERFTLRDAIEEAGERIVGRTLWDRYGRWPVFAKFFDNMGPIPHHMHQDDEQAGRVGQQGKAEGYYFPPQLNSIGNNFPFSFFGLNPDTTRAQVRRCLERWGEGDNGILDLSPAQRLAPGTGWIVPPRVLHAPGSLLTFEPQWASDVMSAYQSMVEDRPIGWDLLVKDVPEDQRENLDYLVDQLDWEANTDPSYRAHHYLEPIPAADTASEGYQDRWVVYGRIHGEQRFSARELTVEPGARCEITDPGASSLIVTQGKGRANRLDLDCPSMIGFHELTRDEVFITEPAARSGVVFENTSDVEPLVVLRYFGPDVKEGVPRAGDHRR